MMMNAHDEIRSQLLKVGTEKWTDAAFCLECWVEEEGGRVPYTMSEEHRVEEICYSCHMPTRSGIYVRRRCVVKALNRKLFWAKIVDAGKPEKAEASERQAEKVADFAKNYGGGLRPGQLG